MFPSLDYLYETLARMLETLTVQGFQIDGWQERLAALAPGYDAYLHFARELAKLPYRPDWSYREPDDYEEILSEMAIGREKCITDTVRTCIHNREMP